MPTQVHLDIQNHHDRIRSLRIPPLPVAELLA